MIFSFLLSILQNYLFRNTVFVVPITNIMYIAFRESIYYFWM